MSNSSDTRKTNKSEKTRSRIVNTFLNLMKQKKWDSITVKEICENCSITRSTFYQYYSDIYDLIEVLETSLLDELAEKYRQAGGTKFAAIPEDLFVEKFNYAPPQIFLIWFEFVKKNKKALFVLLDRNNGDAYFVRRLKQVMSTYINRSMDEDGLPVDALRSRFLPLLLEMHLHSAQLWIEEDSDEILSISDIVNLLNTIRVGACYLSFKNRTDPDFDLKMKIRQ